MRILSQTPPKSAPAIERAISVDQVKKVYRKLAMKNHPDKGGSQEAMTAINEMYSEILGLL